MKKLLFALLIAAALPTYAQTSYNAPASADDGTPRPSFTVFVGDRSSGDILANQLQAYNQDVKVASSANFGVAVDIPLSGRKGKYLQWELAADRGSSHVGADVMPHDLTASYYTAGILLQYPLAHMTPYAGFAIGAANIQIPHTQSTTIGGGAISFGLKVPITPRVGLRFDLRGNIATLSNAHVPTYTCIQTDDDGNDYDATCGRNSLQQGEANVGVYFRF